MILTCPSCDTRYFVKDGAVPAGGRAVRCASCANEWRALPEATPLTLGDSKPAAEISAPASTPQAYRARVQAQRRTRDAAAAGAVWAVLSAVFVALTLAAVLFRVDVVRAFPRANAAYAAMRMPVNPTGLSLEGVTGGPGLENGRQILVVTGSLRNVEAAPRAPAALTVALFDKAGRRQAAQRVVPASGEIAPGETRPFRAVFYDPPVNATEFGVDFAWDAARPAVRKAPPHSTIAAVAPPRGPAASALAANAPAAGAPPEPTLPHGPVSDAAPLPASSPYALPAAR